MIPNALGFLGGFVKISDSKAHGTNHAAYLACSEMARLGEFDQVDIFIEGAEEASMGGLRASGLTVPAGIKSRLLDVKDICYCNQQYMALYSSGVGWLEEMPFALRPANDAMPVIAEIDCSHLRTVWTQMLVGMMSGWVRPTDGLVFKSKATESLYKHVWNEWRERYALKGSSPQCLVSPNPIELEKNIHSPALRQSVRAMLGVSENQVVFLTFSRIEPNTKGDAFAMLVRWAEIAKESPNAILLMAGAMGEYRRWYGEKLLRMARGLGIANRFILLNEPFNLIGNARNALMSAADVFLHMSTGVEESAPLTVLEAMAHGLPPVVAGWSGMVEQVENDVTGVVLPLVQSRAPEAESQGLWGRNMFLANAEASSFASVKPEAFRRCVNALTKSKDKRRALGEAAHHSVKQNRNVEVTMKGRIEYIRHLAKEAVGTYLPMAITFPVSIDSLVDNLSSGTELSPKDRVKTAGDPNAAILEDWINKRANAMAMRILELCKGEYRHCSKVLDELVNGVNVDECSDEWNGEVGRHFSWIVLRLIAGGYLELEERA